MKKLTKKLTKDLFEATYVADNAEDIKKLKSSGVLSKDDTVMMDDEKGTSSSGNDSSMALSENSEDNKEESKEPITVIYLSNMKGEKPFEIHGDKYEYVWGKYPNGERHPAVYCFKDDMTISYPWFKEHILKHKIEENSGVNRPKDAKGNDITLKARVIDINTNNVGHVLQFALGDNNEEMVLVDWMNGTKIKVLPNSIVVDDNSRIVREQNDVVDGTNIPKLQQDVKVLVDKIETVLKPYLNKINKPVEQAELIAAIAERIGIPRAKLSNIIGQLRTIASQTNTTVQQDVTSTSQVNENRKVIKTIKVKDIVKESMNQDEKLKYGKLVYELYKQYKDAASKSDVKLTTELLEKLNKLKLINPEYFDQTVRLIGY